MPLYKSFGLICLFDMLSAGEPCACLCRNVTAAVLRRWDVSGAGMNQNRSDLIGWVKKVGSSSGWIKKVGWHNTFGGLECHSWLAWLFLGNRLQAARKVLWTVFSKCDSSSSYIYITTTWVSIMCNEMSLCFSGHPIQNIAQHAIPNMLIYHGEFAFELRTSSFFFNARSWGLNYRGFALAPCDVSLAMLSLGHRLVRLTIDMLLHSYMHKWKHSWFRLQVRVQLVLGGLVYTIALQSVENRLTLWLTAWKQEVVANNCSESVIFL